MRSVRQRLAWWRLKHNLIYSILVVQRVSKNFVFMLSHRWRTPAWVVVYDGIHFTYYADQYVMAYERSWLVPESGYARWRVTDGELEYSLNGEWNPQIEECQDAYRWYVSKLVLE